VTVGVVLLGAVALLAVAIVGGTALAPSSPNAAGPAWYSFAGGLSAYDAVAGFDLWLLAYGSTWTYAHGEWSNITSTAGVPTNMENNVRMAYDARDGYVLLYGGSYTHAAPYGGTYELPLSETWAFEGGRWTNLTSAVHGAPPPMVLGLMSYDSEDNAVVLFGGNQINTSSSVGGPATNETWTYAADVWTNATVPGPPPLAGTFTGQPFFWLIDDSADGYLVYYNALMHSPLTPGSITWSFRGGIWTNRTASFGPAPELISFGGIAYDSTSRTIIAEGSCVSTTGFTCADRNGGTYQFSNGRWTALSPPTSPPLREDSGFVDDPPDGGVVMAGGCCWTDLTDLTVGWQDVWVYSHGTWTESDPWGGVAPSWVQNDGTWVAFALALVAGVSVLCLLRKQPPSNPEAKSSP